MKFLDAEFVQGFIRMANDGWEQGWHERNGGNLSYRVKPEEVEAMRQDRNLSGNRTLCLHLEKKREWISEKILQQESASYR